MDHENRIGTRFSGSLSPRARGALPLGPTPCARPLKVHAAPNFRAGGGMKRGERGFTLIEMIVAVALFAVVMLVSVGALLSLVGANRKAQALQSVMNNLNIALDGMVRSIRMGSEYDGSYSCSGNTSSSPKDCTEGSARFVFKSFEGETIMYVYDTNNSYCGTSRLCKSVNGGAYLALTASEVTIDALKFYVIGTTRGDTTQPKVVFEVKGTAAANLIKARTTFNIQATAVQRLLDL